MKNLNTAGFLVVCMLWFSNVNAQEPIPVKQQIPDKPQLFQQLPERFECNAAVVQRLLQAETGQPIVLNFSDRFSFEGTVGEMVQRSASIKSINLRSTNLPGLLFNVTISTNASNEIIVSGRMVHPQKGDVLLFSLINGKYYLQKQQQKYFLAE